MGRETVDLTNKLKQWRKTRGLSVREVSEFLNIPESTYRGYEYGSKLPANLVPQVCQLFGLSFDHFFSHMGSGDDNNHSHDINHLFHNLTLIENSLSEVRRHIKFMLKTKE